MTKCTVLKGTHSHLVKVLQDPSDPFPTHPEDADVPEGQQLVPFRLQAAEKLREAGNACFKQVWVLLPSQCACHCQLRGGPGLHLLSWSLEGSTTTPLSCSGHMSYCMLGAQAL